MKKLKRQKEEFYKMYKKIMRADSSNLFSFDLFCMGVIQRSIYLISGFETLANNSNPLCALSLTRLHLDSLLQLYGGRLVKDIHDFAKHKIGGKETRDYKSKEGKKMTDMYLRKKFFADPNNKGGKGLEEVYKTTSGFIHFSDKHIFQSFGKIVEEKNGKILFETVISDKKQLSKQEIDELYWCIDTISSGILYYLNSRYCTKNLNPRS